LLVFPVLDHGPLIPSQGRGQADKTAVRPMHARAIRLGALF
jgi:hypothetical protein